MKKLLPLLTIFFALFINFNALAQLSRKHYIPPLTNDDGFSDQYIYISTPRNQAVAYKITAIGQPDLPVYSGVVSNGSPVEQAVLNSAGNPDFANDSQLQNPINNSSTVLTNKGFIIEAEKSVYVSIRVRSDGRQFHAGALVSKGTSALGNNFRIGGSILEGGTVSGHANFGSIMATEDNTTVTISDLPVGINLVKYTGSFPITFNLNEGESYVVAVAASLGGDPKDLVGGLISSDKPIVVNCGFATGSFGNGRGRDYGFDQIVDASKIGSEYIFVKGNGGNGQGNSWENVLIIAHEDNTTVSVNGNAVSATINKGEYYVIEGGEYNANGNMYVKTSKPTFAYQNIGGAFGSQPNQGMFFVPPLSCENRGDVNNIADIDKIGGGTFNGGITIVTNKGAMVTINRKPISSFNVQGPFDVDGKVDMSGISLYETYKVTGLTGNVEVQSDRELYCAYFNQNGAAASGSFYSGFPSAPEINFKATVMNLGNCIPNITLESGTIDALNSYEWFYDDGLGGGFVSTGVSGSAASSYTPTQPGDYKLVVTLSCSNTTFESDIVPISICPDDADNDLIIDNLDVDLDNDGILNCDESNGNVEINLSNINTPTSSVQNNPINSSIVINGNFSESNTGTGTNTFTGSANGDFISTVTIGATSIVNYNLTFTKNINFKFTEAAGITHTAVDGEFFVVKTSPNNKNITLLDPDDLLLVDTDFNGEFETGVTYVSSSEIRFKYNTAATGTTPYQFIANSVANFSLTHNLNNTTTSSTFNGNISLTCFARDSDNDGVEDAFDIDSDNDGIPDIIEATGANTVLSGTDTNLDGLDDVFNGLTTNNDSDGDGILNYLDLDSDNDGIYDLTEAAHSATDVNLDGIIDNANTGSGANGLFDLLETTPNSNAINYIIADTDTDTNPNFLESDSDNDNCNDVTEAGFTDVNTDGFLGATPVQVNTKGIVINTLDGYTLPDNNYITSAPILLNTPFVDVTQCNTDNFTITIDSNADTFQWQVSTDGGTIWNPIIPNITYSGETTNTLSITDVPFSFNNYQYQVVLGRTGNSCGLVSNSITLTVNPLPTPVNVTILQCDDDTDLITDVNLELEQSNISTNYLNETFEYYTNITDAKNGFGPSLISDPTDHNAKNLDIVYVRTISAENCSAVSQIKILISFTPNKSYDETFVVCDDFLDTNGNDTPGSNNDTDGITWFRLNKNYIISQINTDPTIQVTFYETKKDRDLFINQIDIANYRNINVNNTNGDKFPIFYKLRSQINKECFGLGQIYLQVKPVPIANIPSDFEFCDDALSGNSNDGENENINLQDKINEILGTTQTSADYIVTFHTSQADANNLLSNGIPNDTNFRNTAPIGFTPGDISEQTIYVRVQDRNTSHQCYNSNSSSFKIRIYPNPVISTTITPLAVCDVATLTDSDTRNRVTENIDFSDKTTEILNNRKDNRVAYYTTHANASLGTPEITNTTSYQNDPALTTFPSNFLSDAPGVQTIFYKVINLNGNMCQSVISTFQLLVYPKPNIPLNISDYNDCDNQSDSFVDDENGINGDISLKNKIPEILVNYQPSEYNDFNITFYTSLSDAQANDISLAINKEQYQNTTNNQTIFVRVENIKNTPIACIHTNLSFNININPLPDFSVTGEKDIDDPQIICLDINGNGNLVLRAENPAAQYDYVWKNQNGDFLGGNSSELNITSPGEYTVTASDASPNGCSRTRIIVVETSQTATITNMNVTINDDINGSNTNAIIIDNNIGIGDYEFALLDDNGNTIRDYQDARTFENLEGGIYTIYVRDKNGCGPNQTLTVPVIEFPKFFTPNGDGIKDTWAIKGLNSTFYPGSKIFIFNRQGKVMAEMPIDGNGWNGTYNGNKMPSSDYWFTITLIDRQNNPQKFKGHFSLLRR